MTANSTRRLLGALALIAVAVFGLTAFTRATSAPDTIDEASLVAQSISGHQAQQVVATSRRDAQPQYACTGTATGEACPAEPHTAQGYQDMFDTVPVAQWGGGDVSISTRLSDGRRLWLFGDTLSIDNEFVHSTALVQDGKDLHVSNGGAQVLPNDKKVDGYKSIYWVETVTAGPNSTATVVAAPMGVAEGLFNFHRRAEQSRAAKVRVTGEGDVVFVKWLGWVPRPDIGMDGEDVEILGHAHYAYAKFVHDIPLAGGGWLKTTNQNWDDAFDDHLLPANELGIQVLDYHDWRPMFSSSPTRTSPYWGR